MRWMEQFIFIDEMTECSASVLVWWRAAATDIHSAEAYYIDLTWPRNRCLIYEGGTQAHRTMFEWMEVLTRLDTQGLSACLPHVGRADCDEQRGSVVVMQRTMIITWSFTHILTILRAGDFPGIIGRVVGKYARQ